MKTFNSYQVRDLKAVGNKFFHVLYPRQQTSLLTECKFVKMSFNYSKLIQRFMQGTYGDHLFYAHSWHCKL